MTFGLYISNERIDLFQDETIVMNRQVKDLQNIDGVLSDYTQDFTLPATDRNNSVFSHYYNVDIVGGFNAHLSVDARIEIHGLEIFTGVIELTGVSFELGQPKSYNVVFYGDGKKLSATMGEETLQNVDLSEYDHTANTSAVTDSWARNLHSGSIVYPLIAWGRPFNYSSQNIGNNIKKQTGEVLIDDLKPAIKLKDLVRKCIENYGYDSQGSFYNDAMFRDLYVCPSPTAGTLSTTGTEALFEVTAGSGSFASSGYYWWRTENFTTEVTDDAQAFDLTSDDFTAQGTGSHSFQYSFRLDTMGTLTNGTAVVQYGLFVNNVLHGVPMNAYSLGTNSHTWLVNLYAGDKVEIRIRSNVAITYSNRNFQCINAPIGFAGSTISMSDLMPNIKVADFISNVLKTFNAVLVPVDDTRIDIELLETWLGSGNQRKWTKHIDLQIGHHKKVSVPRTIDMRHKESDDFVNQTFSNQFARPFGSVHTSPAIDFGNDTLEIESIFTIVPPTHINEVNSLNVKTGVTDLQVIHMLDGKGDPTTADLLMFFYNGQVSTSDQWYFEGTQYNTYPQASTFSANQTTNNTYSCGFSLEASINGAPPTKTIFDQCWLEYVSRIYSSQSRIVEYEAYLPVGEWINLKLNDTIVIGGYSYKIESISYDLGSQKAQLSLYTYPDVELASFASTTDNGITATTPSANDNGLTFIGVGDQAITLGNATNTTGSLNVGGYNLVGSAQLQTSVQALQQAVQPEMIVMERSSSYNLSMTTTYQTITYDTTREYNTTTLTGTESTGVFEIGSTGMYNIFASIAISEAGGTGKYIAIYVNDTLAIERSWHTSAGSAYFGTTLPLSEDDEVTLKAKLGSGSQEADVTTAKLQISKQ